MMQLFDELLARFGQWMAEDPTHVDLWLTVGLALAICCVALLAFEQLQTQPSEQN